MQFSLHWSGRQIGSSVPGHRLERRPQPQRGGHLVSIRKQLSSQPLEGRQFGTGVGVRPCQCQELTAPTAGGAA
jgi:hypothetical protein